MLFRFLVAWITLLEISICFEIAWNLGWPISRDPEFDVPFCKFTIVSIKSFFICSDAMFFTGS